MAYASWLNPSKTSGSGNDTVSFGASEYTGRVARTTTVTFSASGVTPSPELAVTQSGKAEFVSIDATATVAKTGGSVTISGTSNSSKLTFTETGTDGIGITLPSSYTANSVSTNNGSAITGDPGASQQYTFSITISNIGANATPSELTSQITVTPNSGTAAVCNITQAAGDPTLSISPSSITIPAAGTAQSVSVTSNTNWSIA